MRQARRWATSCLAAVRGRWHWCARRRSTRQFQPAFRWTSRVRARRRGRPLPRTIKLIKFLALFDTVSVVATVVVLFYWCAENQLTLWQGFVFIAAILFPTIRVIAYRAAMTQDYIRVTSIFYRRQVLYRDIEEINLISKRGKNINQFFYRLALRVKGESSAVQLDVSYNQEEIP